MKHNNYCGFDPHTVTVIRRAARKLIGRYGFTEDDLHDIEQDFHVSVWTELKELQNVTKEAAVNIIVDRRTKDRIRKQKRERRDYRREAYSLDDPDPDADDPDNEDDIASTLDFEEKLENLMGLASPWHKHRAEAVDFADALASLPDDLRDLADALNACGGNVSDAARMMGVGRKKARLMLARLQMEFF